MSDLPACDLEVIGAFVDDALALGHKLSVSDGEEYTVKRSTDRAEIMGALGTTDADSIVIRDQAGERIGWVSLVYGNEPGVVVSDHTDTPAMNAIMARASEIGDRIYNAS
jgi:hypothetical protein